MAQLRRTGGVAHYCGSGMGGGNDDYKSDVESKFQRSIINVSIKKIKDPKKEGVKKGGNGGRYTGSE